MSDGFEVVTEDLTRHAGTVEGLGGQLESAGNKGKGVDLGVQTYGIIGQAFSMGVRSNISETGDAITEMATALKDTAEGIRACAEEYDQVEQANSTIFSGGS
jgi:uncharacterized protein YukE